MNKHLNKAISSIDWNLLREQKNRLMSIIDLDILAPSQRDALDGILQLIDNLQEAVVADNIVTEEEVCGPLDEEEESNQADIEVLKVMAIAYLENGPHDGC